MTWPNYIDNLMNNNNMSSCGILGLDGNQWAVSKDFPIEAQQVNLIIASIKDANKLLNGLTVENDRYIFVRSDSESFVIFKKNTKSIIAYKAQSCILIGISNENVKAEVVLNELGRMVDYLIKNGY